MVKKIKMRPVQQKLASIPTNKIQIPLDYPDGVPKSEREGVFVHSFKCWKCGLHFNLYSWKADKHTVSNTFCPECGQQGYFLHWRSTLNENPTRNSDNKVEISGHVPFPGSENMSDSYNPFGGRLTQ